MRLLPLATLGLAALAACGSGPSAPERPPILLLAVDGLEWEVLLPLVQRGEMPAVRALMERGTFGQLTTFNPTASPIIWTTIGTGKDRDQHGIEGFVWRDEEDQPHLFTSADRRTKAFWNVLTDFGLDSAVLGWWITWPAERIRGLMVAQTNTQGVLGEGAGPQLLKGSLQEQAPGQVWPPSAEPHALEVLRAVDADLDGILEREYGLTPGALPQPEARLLESTRWSLRADETYLRIALDRLAGGEAPALTAVYTGGTDVIGHRFWRHAFPEQFDNPPSEEMVERLGGLLEAAYRRVDRVLAALLEDLPPDATVLIVSDHGMHAIQTEAPFGPDDELVELLSGHHPDAAPGVVIAAGTGIRPPATPPAIDALEAGAISPVATVFDVTPTLLALLGLPVGEDMSGQARTEWIDPDWLAAHPVRTLPSHDTAQWQTARERRQLESADLTERIDQLRNLGYVR